MGCSLTPLPNSSIFSTKKEIYRLNQMLLELNSSIDSKEANDLSKEAVWYSHSLASNYKVVSPPLWHNTLVNVGIRKKGLCYEWAGDLLRHLLSREYKSFRFYFIGSDIGNYFEHNALAVTFDGGDLNHSIVLDAWRNSGNLYFDKIENDKKYSWKKRYRIYREIKNEYHQDRW